MGTPVNNLQNTNTAYRQGNDPIGDDDSTCAEVVVNQVAIPLLIGGGVLAGAYALYLEFQRQTLLSQGRSITQVLNSSLTEEQFVERTAHVFIVGLFCAMVVICKCCGPRNSDK